MRVFCCKSHSSMLCQVFPQLIQLRAETISKAQEVIVDLALKTVVDPAPPPAVGDLFGYVPWVTLKPLLLCKRSDFSPTPALDMSSRLQRADIVLSTTDGREIRLRRISEPTAEEQVLLNQLGLHLPERLG